MAAPPAAGIGETRPSATTRSEGGSRPASRCGRRGLKGSRFTTKPATTNGTASQTPSAPVQSAFQREESGEERQDEEAEIAQVERRVRRPGPKCAKPKSSGILMRDSRGDRQSNGRGGIARARSATKPSLPGETTSCFQRRSEYSRANSRDSESRSPRRLTATRNASSSSRPASRSASTWLRRWSSSSSTSTE